jgi:uncharacterized protein (DUF2147 family)
MRRIYPSIICLALMTVTAQAGEPTGEWEVEGGFARVRIENCGDALWGAISWEKEPGGIDDKNPDAKLRNRPVLGMPILLNMKLARDRWEGEVYNSQDGKTYSATIKVVNPDTLKLEGCVLSIFCGSQNWTRVPAQVRPGQAAVRPAPGPAPRPAQSDGRSAKANPRPTAPAQPSGAAQASQDFCLNVTGLAGGTHESGLKQDGRR